MRNIKKIISILICFTLIMSFPFGAVNAETALDNVLMSEYRGLFQALDMELMSPGTMVTRGQFITNLVELMGFGSYGTSVQTFLDVNPDNEKLHSAVEYAVGIGALSKADNFYPDRQITCQEALKITVEALGYGKDAQFRGGYPTGHYTVASMIDLLDGIDINADFTSDTMYTLLGNAAHTNVKVMTSCKSDGELVGYTLEVTEPLLSAYRDVTRINGVITASDSGYLYDSTQNLDSGKVMIDDVEYAVKKGVICPLGYYANAYAQKSGNKLVIIYADISSNVVTTVPASQISDFKSNTFYYYDAKDREKKVSIDSEMVVLYNGKTLENYKKDDILIRDGYVELVDNNSNGSFDILCVWNATYLLVDYVNVYSNEYDYVFYDKNRKNNIFITSETNFRSNVNLSSIAKEGVLETFVSKDQKFVTINLLGESVSGSVSEVGYGGTIYVGGKEYETTAYFNEFYGSLLTPGKTFSFVVDSLGKAVAATSAGTATMKYAYFDEMADAVKGLDDSVKLKLFTEDREVITPKLASKVTVNSTTKNARDCVSLLASSKGELIKYKLNDAGEISKINTESEVEGIFDPAQDGADTLKRFRFTGDDSETLVYYKEFGYIVPHFTLSSATKIFKISLGETNDEEKFSLTNLSFLKNDARIASNSIRPYNVTVYGLAGAVLYKTNEAAATSVSSTSSSAMVAGCSMALTEDGDEVYKIKLYSGNKFYDYFIKKDARFLSGLTFNENGYPFNNGDVIRYVLDGKGEYLLTAVKDFDGKTKTLLFNASDNTELHYYYGQLYAEGEGSVAIRKDDGSIIYIPHTIGDAGILEDGEIMTHPKEKITTYLQMGEDCHKVILRCYYSSVWQTYVIK